MATEPLDAPNDSDLVERRRWSGGTKVYRRKNKGQRNTNSSLTVSGNDEVSKGTEIGSSVSNSDAQGEDGGSLIVEAPGKGDENCCRLGQEEEGGIGGVSVSNPKDGLIDSSEVVVPSADGVADTVGQEAGDSPGETVGRKSKDVDGTSVVGSRIEQEEGSGNDMLQSIREVAEDGDSRGDAADQDGKEALLSSMDDEQSQHEDGPSGEIVRRGSNEMLPESREELLLKDDQLGQAVVDIHRETTGMGSDDGLSGHEEGTTHVDILVDSDVLPENRVALGPQEDNGRLGQGEGASGGETVRISDDESPESREVVVPQHSGGRDVADGNGVVGQNKLQLESHEYPSVITRVDDKLRINVSGARSRDEIRGVKRKLESELDRVQRLFKRVHSKELQVTASNCNPNNGFISNVETVNTDNIGSAVSTYGDAPGNFDAYIQPQYSMNDAVERTLTRVGSEVGSVFHRPNKLFNRSLSVSVVDNNHGVSEFYEREKRTPKANQLYRNSEFLLGKDRLPSESNKKLKSNGTADRRFGFPSDKFRERAFKSCNTLLQRLMKHNFGWVFNEPVDAKKLLLHDYHDIIKHPMDLGTIKSKLSQNYYKSPMEFAEDVRLVFRNAMTYNPKGHDVNVMAETLLNIFEERWAVIETEYNPDWRYQMYQDTGFPTPPSRKIPATQFYTPARISVPVHTPVPAHELAPVYTSVTPVPQTTLENSQSMMMNTAPILKPPITHVARTPAPKKPKARDPNKRDMTYDEKQKLSTNLQSLPSEKLDAIVQIIKKRNSSLSQHNDEIEVDIDSVDAETLWELDRFVTNYKKSLSKNKRKAELALQTRAGVQTTSVTNIVAGAMEMQKDNRIGENNDPSAQAEKQGGHASRSSSSSSSSSDSGSSSSDSDSDSSSSSRSDSGHSPRT